MRDRVKKSKTKSNFRYHDFIQLYSSNKCINGYYITFETHFVLFQKWKLYQNL